MVEIVCSTVQLCSLLIWIDTLLRQMICQTPDLHDVYIFQVIDASHNQCSHCSLKSDHYGTHTNTTAKYAAFVFSCVWSL